VTRIRAKTMQSTSYELHGVPIFECAAHGPELRNDRDAVDVISEAWGHQAQFIVIPTGRLGDDFFRLSTRIAGEVIQKFLTYGLRVAIVGDISRHVGESSSLRDFVYESNRGDRVWFVANHDELDQRLSRARIMTE
jgi:hypothetical protein